MSASARFEGWGGKPESLLRQLWAGGYSAAQIGRVIGVSRNAVCGKAKRLGLRWQGPTIVDARDALSFAESRALAEQIVSGAAEITADIATWPEDRWMQLIADIHEVEHERAACPRSSLDLDLDLTPVGARSAPAAPRPGQADFRASVLSNYRHRCCISGAGEIAAVHAAHVVPHARGGGFSVENGLALRADLHSLFDAGLLTIDAVTLRVRLSPQLRCASYSALNASEITPAVRAPPSAQALRWHERNIFRH